MHDCLHTAACLQLRVSESLQSLMQQPIRITFAPPMNGFKVHCELKNLWYIVKHHTPEYPVAPYVRHLNTPLNMHIKYCSTRGDRLIVVDELTKVGYPPNRARTAWLEYAQLAEPLEHFPPGTTLSTVRTLSVLPCVLVHAPRR